MFMILFLYLFYVWIKMIAYRYRNEEADEQAAAKIVNLSEYALI